MAMFGENTCKAWADATMAGTMSLRDSYNFSSVADIGTGRIRFSFDVDAVLSKYAIATLAGNNSGTTTSARTQCLDSSRAAANFTVRNLNVNNTNTTVDDTYIGVIVFMDT
jgi:hypothetical protein